MAKIILVTGGARSGKSSFAEKMCENIGTEIAYIATAIPFDDGMLDRIKKHREQRPSEWETFEISRNIDKNIKDISLKKDTVLLDCITVLVNNIMFEEDVNWDNCSHDVIDEIEEKIKVEIKALIEAVKNTNLNFIMVTNEVGLGIVPENRLARIYRDIAGRVNQILGQYSNEIYLVVCGAPLKIKGE